MARRTNLREFQEQLTARLNGAHAGPSISARLGFLLREQRWLVDLTCIDEVIPVPALDSVPLTRPWYAGVANVRGRLFTVVDLAAFVGLPPVEVNRDARIVLVKSRLMTGTALMVSAIAGLRSTASMTRMGAGEHEWEAARYVESTQGANEKVWRELDLSALTQRREFLDVAA